MSDEEKNQGNQQPAKGTQAEAENRPNTQPHSAETPQTFDGLPSMRAYDTAYPPLNQYSSTLLLLLKPIQPLNPRQTSAWLSVPSAATPAPPSSLNHIVVMGGSGSQIPSTGPGLPHNNYSYGMGGRYGTPGASESASGHGYGENNQAPLQKPASLTLLNLEFCQPNKKSRPNSPTASSVNLYMTPSVDRHLANSPPRVHSSITTRAGNPAFIISPNETPLQTPSHSPPLQPQNPSDKGLNSTYLISELEKQKDTQSQAEHKTESIADNGTTLPPIRSVFNFNNHEGLQPLHVKREQAG